MNESSIQAVRARAKALYTSANADERSVLDLLLAAADDPPGAFELQDLMSQYNQAE